ncbi:hypothetical protein [Microcoleus sp. AT3-A2]
MASLLAIRCWGNELYPSTAIGSVRGGQSRLSHLPIACCQEWL